jgi:hypothetical protein
MTTIQIQVPESLAKHYLRFGEKDFIEGIRYTICQNLKKEKRRLEEVLQKIQTFEEKYKADFETFEKNFPDTNDYQIHEDYVEWSHWVDVAKAIENDIEEYSRLYGTL